MEIIWNGCLFNSLPVGRMRFPRHEDLLDTLRTSTVNRAPKAGNNCLAIADGICQLETSPNTFGSFKQNNLLAWVETFGSYPSFAHSQTRQTLRSTQICKPISPFPNLLSQQCLALKSYHHVWPWIKLAGGRSQPIPSHLRCQCWG